MAGRNVPLAQVNQDAIAALAERLEALEAAVPLSQKNQEAIEVLAEYVGGVVEATTKALQDAGAGHARLETAVGEVAETVAELGDKLGWADGRYLATLPRLDALEAQLVEMTETTAQALESVADTHRAMGDAFDLMRGRLQTLEGYDPGDQTRAIVLETLLEMRNPPRVGFTCVDCGLVGTATHPPLAPSQAATARARKDWLETPRCGRCLKNAAQAAGSA